ncbi:MAG: chemotaxis protein CheW [bacterium]|nr:chemotaxis protein CheW [bacterium]
MKSPGIGAAPSQRAKARDSIELIQLVAFGVADGDYAVDIMRIKEIINPVAVRPMPKAPPFIEGVIELRGAILPIVDVRKRFDLAATAATRATKYLIVALDIGAARIIVGLVVDRVSEPLRVPRADIKPAPRLSISERAFFTGVVGHHGKMLMVLDVDALLSSAEKETLSGMSGNARG